MNKNQLLRDYIDKLERNSKEYKEFIKTFWVPVLFEYVKEHNIDYATLAIALCANNTNDRKKAIDVWGVSDEYVNFGEIRELFSDYISDKWQCNIFDKRLDPESESWISFDGVICSVRIEDNGNHIYIDGGDSFFIESFDEEFKDANDLGRFLNWIK